MALTVLGKTRVCPQNMRCAGPLALLMCLCGIAFALAGVYKASWGCGDGALSIRCRSVERAAVADKRLRTVELRSRSKGKEKQGIGETTSVKPIDFASSPGLPAPATHTFKYGEVSVLKRRREPSSGLEYLLWRPAAAKRGPLPLVVFLHGAGESGADVSGLVSEGATGCPPVELERGTAAEALKGFIVASPQTSMGWSGEQVARFVDALWADAAIGADPARTYVTGVSMGGAGVWSAAATGRFAAAAPVCAAGGAPPAERLKGVGVWVFHGANDVIVPVDMSDDAVKGLKEAGREDVKYTRYDQSPAPIGWPDYDGHASWMQAYQGDELWRWMLKHRRETR